MNRFASRDLEAATKGEITREELYTRQCESLADCIEFTVIKMKATLGDYLGLQEDMAQYILAHPSEASFETLKDLARLLDVSEKFLLITYGVAQRKLTYLDAVQIGAALKADGLQAA